ncbi:hypothetical protein BBW68_09735 [Candidatus Erwinia dacicola]|uniref:Cytosine deaminase domain protein n=1 Tax=Candidatus Erwinia dacicola TaxID=252393 RepID=A0A1E7Z149_9GAMM|nr:hypothetical protein BBW68_09735 [Candidatus Erwinia dacicola]RAP71070.1 cytosine deaminase domain protein [Candidatus Erwinia dacicola]
MTDSTYDQLDSGIKLITTNSANLVILPADSGFDALRRQVTVRYSIRYGKIIAETVPAASTIRLAESEKVDFRR